ncbi:Y-family DNA polymerase [Ferrimonas lipolytica]|uniref:DNA polymerase Y family protein n=1 Tax=Ferrimonas lipolytica TaxID=2724191 RepID=A0A6H1UD97_9GAMM|nr:DNA polymerase Y family protein [Ferrimonas lipolytica]QIZ76186.1 DNA polymerase Y family protein [Ferrimonas lipolytica]
MAAVRFSTGVTAPAETVAAAIKPNECGSYSWALVMLLGLHFIDLELHSQAQAHQFVEGDAAAMPIALVGGHPLLVLQCNDSAMTAGVREGQKLGTATALCAELMLLQQDSDQQQRALQELAAWAYGFSAQVMVVEPDTLVLEVQSMLRLFGGLSQWQTELQTELNLRGLPWRQALAHTPLAATLLARNAIAHQQPERAAVMAALAPLKLQHCMRPEAPRLASMGVLTLGQLAQLPRAELGQRFGAELLLWLEQLQGQRPDPRQWFMPPQHYQRKLILLHEISHTTTLRFPLKRLFGELEAHLRRCQLALPQLQLHLIHRHRPVTIITLRGAGNEHRAEAWQRLCELQLERLTLYEPIIEIELIGRQLQPLLAQSGTLIGAAQPEGKARDLLAQLSARLGAGRVCSVQALAEHRPEYASKTVTAGEGGDHRGESALTLQRPTWLLRQPQAIARTEIELQRGPERIESGWWQADPIARDYFIALNQSGGQCWVFHCAEGWFLHGWF